MLHTTLIRSLLSNENDIRRQAEATYTQLKAQQPQELAVALLTLACIQSNPDDADTRLFAPVLLRRLLETDGLANDAAYRSNMKQQLLSTLVLETEPQIRRKVTHVIAQVARQDANWPDLLPSIINLTQSSDIALQVTALDVLGTLAEYTGGQFTVHHEQLGSLFSSFVASTAAPMELRVAAWKALSAFVVHLESNESLQPYTQLLPPFLQILEHLLQLRDEASARSLLTSFLTIAEVHPNLLLLHLDMFGSAMLSIAQSSVLGNDTRILALECLLSICEHASQLVRSSKVLLEAVVSCVLVLLAEIPDDDNWVNQFDDQMTLYMDEKASWQQRHAALYAIGLMAEGAKEYLYNELDNWFPRIVASLHDPVFPRVRHAALFCIGHLAKDYGIVERGKNFQAKYHNDVLPPLIPMLFEHETVMRNRGLAASVVCNFCHPEHCRTQFVLPLLEPLLSALFQALQTSPRQVQEQAITAVACVAKVVGDAFVLYYNVFMPVAKQVLTQAHGKPYALLRGKAMECVALIGQAVGKQAFLEDAKVVMDILLRHETDDSGIEVQYLTQACVRIGSVLQEDFVAYLPLIVPKLLQQAATQPDIVLLDWNEQTTVHDDDDEDEHGNNGIQEIVVEIQGQGKKKLQIQTSSLQEKELGLNMLYQLAMDLQGAFVPYIEPVMQVLLPLLRFEYMDTVRMISGLTMAKLLHAAVAGSEITSQGPQQVLEACFEPLLQALLEESDMECIVGLSEAIACVLEECKEGAAKGFKLGIPLAHLPTVFDKLLAVAHASVLRQVQAFNSFNEEDEDEEDHEPESGEDEEAILQNVVDAIGWCIKQYQVEIVPTFVEAILPRISPYLEPSFPAAIRAHFICTVDDMLEYGGAETLLTALLPHLSNSLEDSHPSVIRAAAYGAGVCAQFGGPGFESHCVATLQRVWTCIQALEHDQVETEQAAARDNCVSAVGKFCMYRAHLVDVSTLLGLWLNCLPLQSDAIEARAVHQDFVSMLLSTNMDLLGENYARLPVVLKKLADIAALDEEVDEPIVETDTKAQFQTVLLQIQATIPSQIVQAAWTSLAESDQEILSALMS
ncbi:hypothetical protein Ae201684P_022340 [Aphanomyces euteiches]|nr:hypothetical protein Ae201684P_022340 [Aphanomyces euteiches]